jgi:glycogen operon protein
MGMDTLTFLARTKAWNVDWSATSRVLAFMLCGKHAKEGKVPDTGIYVAMNMHWEMHGFQLPGS